MDEDDIDECQITGKCEAPDNHQGITGCIHCGAELSQVGKFWYHWTQFDLQGNLISPDMPQSGTPKMDTDGK